MKEIEKYDRIWSYNHIPEKDEFVLIADGPCQDFPETIERSKNKDQLIELGNKKKNSRYSSLRVYNDKKLIVWDAALPTTIEINEEAYEPEYFRKVMFK